MLGLGFALNFIVMGVNQGQMPVLWPSSVPWDSDGIHSVMTSASHLKFLADWLVIRGLGIASIGDLLEWTYGLTVIPALAAWVALVLKDYQEY